jgi:hypothetical protein
MVQEVDPNIEGSKSIYIWLGINSLNFSVTFLACTLLRARRTQENVFSEPLLDLKRRGRRDSITAASSFAFPGSPAGAVIRS